MANLSSSQLAQIEQSLPEMHKHLLRQLAALHADDLGLGFLVLSSSKKPIGNLRAVLKKIKARENRPTAFVSVDEERKNAEGETLPGLHETMAAPVQEVGKDRKVVFDQVTEATLKTAALPAKELGKLAKCCVRTAKTKRKALAEEYAGRTVQMPLFTPEVAGMAE